jgi:DNA-binding PadR family transcriptional regulator
MIWTMSLRYAVLGLLAEEPGSGYDLLKTFRDSLANVWPATQSQLYTELGRLTEAGLVEVTAEGARGRKEYDITEAGRAELHHWLVETEPDGFRRNDLLLRVFFLGSLTPREAQDYLLELARIMTERHAELGKLQKHWPYGDEDNIAHYGKLVLEWGVRFTEMQREWSEWAAKEVRRH